MITGYFIRGSAEGAWALVEQDERYREEVVVDGLPYKGAVALYWRKLGELTAPAADPAADPKTARRKPRERPPPQLPLPL